MIYKIRQNLRLDDLLFSGSLFIYTEPQHLGSF